MEAALAEAYRRGSAGSLVLVVDDVHLLSDEVASFLHRVLSNRLAVGLLARRAGASLPVPIEHLLRRGDVEPVELPPLTADDAIEAVECAIGGPLGPEAARELCELSDGNPLHLRELVVDALETEVLVDDQGLWRLHAPVRAGQRVQELVEGRLAALSAAARDVLAVAALQRPMPVDVLAEVGGRSALLTLADRGLLVTDEHGRRLAASPAHAVYGAAALSGLDPLRRRQLLVAAADAWQRTSMGRAEGHAIEGGMRGHVDAHVARALALARCFRWSDAAASFDQALEAEEGHERATAVQYLRAALDHDIDPAAVVALAERLAPQLRGAFEAEVAVASAAMFVRPLGETLARVAALAGNETLSSELRSQVALVRCTARSHQGALHQARREAEDLVAAGTLDRVAHSRAQSVVVEAAAWLGDLDHALAVAATELDEARLRGELDHEMLMRRVLQVALALAGRIGDAVEHGRRNAQMLSLGLGLRVAPAVHHELVLALSELRGGQGEAGEMLEAARRLPPSACYVWAADGLVAASRLASSESQQVELLDRAEASARERGCRIHLARALHERVRRGFGEPPTDELDDLAGSMGGVTQLWARYAGALATGDVDGLSKLSQDAERKGMVGLAGESAARAAHIALRTAEGMGAASVLSARYQRLHGLVPETVLAVGPPSLPLTAREAEAIGAVLDGGSDAEIAGAWVVSRRTVHGHLHRAYRKLGVDGREELAALRSQHDPVAH